jgi:Trk K+ transport system NAD-binding subunit
MKHVIVLGAGMVGRAIVLDLAPRYAVTAVDVDEQRLARLREEAPVHTVTADLSHRRNSSKSSLQIAIL